MAHALVDRFGGEVPDGDARPGDGAGGRSQDGQRGAQRGPRPARPAGRHPRRTAVPAPRADHRDRPGEGRAGAQPDDPGARAGRVQPPADPPRPARLRRPSPRCGDCVLADFCPSATRPKPDHFPRGRAEKFAETAANFPATNRVRIWLAATRFPPPGSWRRRDPPPGVARRRRLSGGALVSFSRERCRAQRSPTARSSRSQARSAARARPRIAARPPASLGAATRVEVVAGLGSPGRRAPAAGSSGGAELGQRDRGHQPSVAGAAVPG